MIQKCDITHGGPNWPTFDLKNILSITQKRDITDGDHIDLLDV